MRDDCSTRQQQIALNFLQHPDSPGFVLLDMASVNPVCAKRQLVGALRLIQAVLILNSNCSAVTS
jgi:hypothetical protein